MNKKIILIIVFVLCMTACTTKKFDGNKIKNDNSYILDYNILNDTLEEDWYLEKGTIIDSNINTTRGTVNIYITNNDTNEYIFESNEKGETTPFSITIRQTETYN